MLNFHRIFETIYQVFQWFQPNGNYQHSFRNHRSRYGGRGFSLPIIDQSSTDPNELVFLNSFNIFGNVSAILKSLKLIEITDIPSNDICSFSNGIE